MVRQPLRRSTQLYVSVVVAFGFLAVTFSTVQLAKQPLYWHFEWLKLAVLTLVSGWLSVKLPTVSASISISETFVFAGTLRYRSSRRRRPRPPGRHRSLHPVSVLSTPISMAASNLQSCCIAPFNLACSERCGDSSTRGLRTNCYPVDVGRHLDPGDFHCSLFLAEQLAGDGRDLPGN